MTQEMIVQGAQLNLNRCPHCSTHKPILEKNWGVETATYSGGNQRHWVLYGCKTCGGMVIASSRKKGNSAVDEYYPKAGGVDPSVTEPAKSFLEDAIQSTGSGAVLAACSAVDAMLQSRDEKLKRLGTLNLRIEKAAENNLITEDMKTWANQVRLDAIDQRHPEKGKPVSDGEDARRIIEFAKALATFLFVVPAMVTRGIEQTKKEESKGN